MKKHPVDDLFKRKLEGMERTPSGNAWLKIQERQPVRAQRAVWGWYAAAGVAAAMMGGYLVWQNQQHALPVDARHTVAVAKPAPIDSAKAVVAPIEKPNAPEEHLAAANNSPAAGPQKEQARVERIALPEVKPAQHAPELAAVEKPLIPVNAIQPENVNIPVAQEIKTLPDEPAVSRVNKPETEPTRTIVVAVETGDNESEEKPRNTRFARVFRQLKNARAGEKVDWDEVGFNPKSLVARVDDRLRSKDDRSLDKDHPKDKTKL